MGTTDGQETFDTEQQAQKYADSFMHAWYGYSASAQVVKKNGKWVVYTHRWNSCD